MTAPLVETAHAKINLALHVRGRQPDGYHDLETLFAFAVDGDRLTGEAAEDVDLTLSGLYAAALEGEADNLVLRAVGALQRATQCRRGVRIHLEKKLPVAAGLGGGSADAAAALRLVVRLWGLDPHDPAIMAVATALGADVPACMESRTCIGIGRGNQLSPFAGPALEGTPVLLVNPGIGLPTAPVFAGWDRIDRGALDPLEWRSSRNDLTGPAVALVPKIAEILARLEAMPGANFVRMSGSGATCFALFDSIETRDSASRQVPFWHMSTQLR